MKKIRNSLFYLSLLISIAFLTSCGDSSQSNADITDSQLNEGESELGDYSTRVKDIFHAVPSPMEMASMLKKVGAQYDAKILNEVKNVNLYTSARSQALNLGIYGADLSYASVFNQNQESIIYLSCVKKLADNLGVTKAFNDDTIERIETNVDNRDSLLTIVAETFYELDSYLKENGREHISAMVIAAGWIEGLYISTSISGANQSPNEELMQRIGEQKLSLANLKELVNAYNSEGLLDEIANDLKTIDKAFEGVTIVQGASGVTTDQDGNTVVGSPTTVTISDEAFQNIKTVVSEIRLRYVS
jgi:hypothetical protein